MKKVYRLTYNVNGMTGLTLTCQAKGMAHAVRTGCFQIIKRHNCGIFGYEVTKIEIDYSLKAD